MGQHHHASYLQQQTAAPHQRLTSRPLVLAPTARGSWPRRDSTESGKSIPSWSQRRSSRCGTRNEFSSLLGISCEVITAHNPLKQDDQRRSGTFKGRAPYVISTSVTVFCALTYRLFRSRAIQCDGFESAHQDPVYCPWSNIVNAQLHHRQRRKLK